MEKIRKTDEQWRAELDPDRYAILRCAATEPPWSGDLNYVKEDSVFKCGACGAELFRSEAHQEFDGTPGNPNISYGWNARVVGRYETSEGDDGPKRMASFKDHLGRPVVAVTGIGVVTSLGQGKQENWAALTSGKSGIHPISRFPVDHLNTRISGMVDFLPSSSKGASALTYELAETAAVEAIEESGLSLDDFGGPLFLASPPVELDWHDRLALYKGGDNEDASERLLEVARGLNASDMFDSSQFGFIADRLADRFGATGLPITLSTACASGATAIQLGVEAIRRGECDRALAIGADGSATAEALIRFSLLSALSTSNDAPEKASKPFSKDRDGFVLA